MTTQHTAGPWAVYQDSICTADGKANEIAKITRYGVWMDDGTPYGPRNPIGDANARLIAAAPDLLAALEWWQAQMQSDDCDDMGALLDEMSAKAQEAIIKAKGA